MAKKNDGTKNGEIAVGFRTDLAPSGRYDATFYALGNEIEVKRDIASNKTDADIYAEKWCRLTPQQTVRMLVEQTAKARVAQAAASAELSAAQSREAMRLFDRLSGR